MEERHCLHSFQEMSKYIHFYSMGLQTTNCCNNKMLLMWYICRSLTFHHIHHAQFTQTGYLADFQILEDDRYISGKGGAHLTSLLISSSACYLDLLLSCQTQPKSKHLKGTFEGTFPCVHDSVSTRISATKLNINCVFGCIEIQKVMREGPGAFQGLFLAPLQS